MFTVPNLSHEDYAPAPLPRTEVWRPKLGEKAGGRSEASWRTCGAKGRKEHS